MKNKIKIPYICLFWVLYLELIYRIFIVGNFLTLSTLRVILFSLIWVVILNLLTYFFKPKINRFNLLFSLSIMVIITLAQIVYYNFYNSIFSFYSLTAGTTQVMQFWQMILEVILRIWYIFAIILIPYILFLNFNNKIVNYNKGNIKSFILTLTSCILVLLGIFLNIKFDNRGIYSLNRLVYSTHAPMLTINETGLYTMQLIDIYRYYSDFEEEDIIIDTNDNIGEEIIQEKEEKREYNVYNINFDELIQNEKNNKVKKLHEYFSSVTPSEKNKYTGMFKDKNLVFITAEGFDIIAIDEQITPTLYKMANEGIKFTNYYQPLYTVSTSDGEYMNVMSLIPKEGVWSFSKSSKLDMKYAIGHMFKNAGYLTPGYHNHTYTYYDRHKSHKNIGLDYMGCKNGLEKLMNCKRWPNSDYEMIEATMPLYMGKEKPFMAYYMTVSGHLNYNFYGNNMASRNKSKVSNLTYSDAIKAYYATQIEFDKAMELLLKELETRGILEDTLIIISPDHYPYGLTTKQLNEVSQSDRSNKFEMYHTALIMYNPAFNGITIDKTLSSLDILPTIYNLYAIEYDSRLYMGRDIFSDSEHIVILSDRSWITDMGKYNSVNKQFINTSNEEVGDEYINYINAQVSAKFSSSSSIIDTDYYSKIKIEKEIDNVSTSSN